MHLLSSLSLAMKCKERLWKNIFTFHLLYIDLGQMREAIKDANKAISLDILNPVGLINFNVNK